jgi:hypothetical protein
LIVIVCDGCGDNDWCALKVVDDIFDQSSLKACIRHSSLQEQCQLLEA